MILRRCRLVIAAAFLACAWSVEAQEPDPETRAEALRREREEKATQLHPPEQSRLEKALLDLEAGRFFERILNPAAILRYRNDYLRLTSTLTYSYLLILPLLLLYEAGAVVMEGVDHGGFLGGWQGGAG